MDEIKQMLINQHSFRVEPIVKGNKNFLTKIIEFPEIKYNKTDKEVNPNYDFINCRIINELEVDFYSDDERNKFNKIFNELRNFHIQDYYKYNYHGLIIENRVNDTWGYYLKISIKD